MILKVDNFRILLHKLFFGVHCIYTLVKNNRDKTTILISFRYADIKFTNRVDNVDIEKLLQIVLF